MTPGGHGGSAATTETTVTCECGNGLGPGERQCQWCQQVDFAKDSQTVPHTWQTSRFTNTTTCSVCGLLPLDPADAYSDCESPRLSCTPVYVCAAADWAVPLA